MNNFPLYKPFPTDELTLASRDSFTISMEGILTNSITSFLYLDWLLGLVQLNIFKQDIYCLIPLCSTFFQAFYDSTAKVFFSRAKKFSSCLWQSFKPSRFIYLIGRTVC